MVSDVDICNMALFRHGENETITNLIDDMSTPGIACRTFYEHSRDTTLEDFDWGFASRKANLALIGNAITDSGYLYEYEYPADCLRFRQILCNPDEAMFSNRYPQIKWELSASDTTDQTIILSSAETPLGRYTKQIINTTAFPPTFIDALAWRLAFEVAPSITNSRITKQDAWQAYQVSLGRAQTVSANQQQQQYRSPPSEFERASGGFSYGHREHDWVS